MAPPLVASHLPERADAPFSPVTSVSDDTRGAAALPKPALTRLPLDEARLDALTHHLEQIRRDVRLVAESRGWRVRFDRPNPLMSNVGFGDGDLIVRSEIDDNFGQNSRLKAKVLAFFASLEER